MFTDDNCVEKLFNSVQNLKLNLKGTVHGCDTEEESWEMEKSIMHLWLFFFLHTN